MKIDFHAHAFPEAFLRQLHTSYPDTVVLRHDAHGHLIGVSGGIPWPAWDHGQRLDDMNAGGVDVEILSTPSWLIDKTQVLYFSSRFLILKNKTSLAALFILLL